MGFAYNVLNHQCGLDSFQMSAGKRWILKINDDKKKVHILKKITLKWHDWFVIFRMTEQKQEKYIELFSYSLVSLLDFGFYIQTVRD